MRQASRRGWKRGRAVNRREPRRIEGGIAARAVERLMGQIAQLVDEQTNLTDVNEVVRAHPWRQMQLPGDQTHQQGFIACFIGSAADRRGFGGGSDGIGGRRSQVGKLLRHCAFLPLGGGSLARLLLLFWLRLGGGLRLGLVERLGIGRCRRRVFAAPRRAMAPRVSLLMAPRPFPALAFPGQAAALRAWAAVRRAALWFPCRVLPCGSCYRCPRPARHARPRRRRAAPFPAAVSL